MTPIDRAVHWALRVGLGAAVVLFALGIALTTMHSGCPREVMMLAEIPRGIVHLDPRALLSLGLIALIGTQFLRVVAALVAFVQERDGRYVLVTATVLIVMGASILLGRG